MSSNLKYPFGAADVIVLDNPADNHVIKLSNTVTIVKVQNLAGNRTLVINGETDLIPGSKLILDVTQGATPYDVSISGAVGDDLTGAANSRDTNIILFDGSGFLQGSWNKVVGNLIQAIHVMITGASQSAGYNADPALTTGTRTNVYTLTDGPLSPDTNGDLVLLSEGDTYDQDAVPREDLNVESMASGLGHQLDAFINDSNYRIIVTIHYRGGTTLTDLSDGGTHSNLGYDQAIAAATRVKAICDANGWNYIPYLDIETSGTLDPPYNDAITNMYDDYVAGLAPLYGGTLLCVVNQQRVQTPTDNGKLSYLASTQRAGIVCGVPIKDVLVPTEIQGDGVHPTNYGQLNKGIQNARTIYEHLITGTYQPLIPDTSSITWDDENKRFVIPYFGCNGNLQGSGDYNTVLYDDTNDVTLSGTWSSSGSTAYFTPLSRPVGAVDLELRTGQGTGTLKDSSDNSAVLYDNASAQKYSLEKPVIRYDFAFSITLPALEFTQTKKVNGNFTGTTLIHTEPGYNSIVNPNSTTIALLEDDDVTDSGFTLEVPGNWGATSGDNGDTSPDFPDNPTKRYSAGNAVTENYMTFKGLDPNKFYDIASLHSRTGGSGGLLTVSHEGASTNSRTLDTGDNNPANVATYNVLKSSKIQSDPSGDLVVRMARVTDGFYRWNAFQLTEFTGA